MDLLSFAAGFIIAALAAWLIQSFRLKSERSTLLAQNRLLETAGAETKAAVAKLQTEVVRLTGDLAGTRAKLANAELQIQNKATEMEQTQARLRLEFENIANRLLEEKASRFTAQNQTNLDQLLNPLKTQIGEFKQKIEQVYTSETADRAALREQIQSLKSLNTQITEEARNLTLALKGDSKAQGNWGELILEKILENSGLTKDLEFTVQAGLKSEDGGLLRPDVIIHLPDNKHLVVDSKVSLTAYERFCSEADPEAQQIALTHHVRSIRAHVDELARKKYQDLYQISAPDLVFMFVPIEPAFSRALQTDPALFNEAFEKRVVLVTPSTLLATLRTIAHIWKQEKQTRNALEIARKSGALYDKFVGLYDDLLKLGGKLKDASDAYHDTLNKLKTGAGNLVKRVEDIKKLGAKAEKTLPAALVQEAEEGNANDGNLDDQAGPDRLVPGAPRVGL